MKYELLISYKYFKSKKTNNFISRISVIGIVIVCLSVAIPIITMSVINGFHKSIKKKHINKDYHIQLLKTKFINYNFVKNHILTDNKIKDKIKMVIPFYKSQVLLKHENSKYYGVFLRGNNTNLYMKDKDFRDNFSLVAGNYSLKKFRIIIGYSLAKKLNININKIKQGKELDIEVLISRERFMDEEFIPIYKFRVSGIFKSGYAEYDNYLAFTNINTSKIVFNTKIRIDGKVYNAITGLGIKLYNPEDADIIKNILNIEFPELTIYTWKELNRHLLHAFNWEKDLIKIVLAIMIIASFLVIYLNLNIVVIDKRKEIGILKSFGVKNKAIRMIFLIEGLIIGLIGTLLGSIFSLLILGSLAELIQYTEYIVNEILKFAHNVEYGTNKQYVKWEVLSGGLVHIKALPYHIHFGDLQLVCIFSIFVSMLASYFPARKSALENIASVIRYE